MNSVVELLCELVRIPSVNPDGNPGVGSEAVGERACAEFVGKLLSSWGASVTLDDVEPGRPNVVARFASRKASAPRLLFAPHLDTVSVAGMTIDPFAAEIRDGKIWGRGTSDTKGSAAAMLVALRDCLDILPDLSHEIWFAGLMGEEAGQYGARALARREKFDFVVVGEPTGLDVVHAHKGSAWVTLRTRGRAVHASTPEHGENAIDHMLAALAGLRTLLEENFATHTHPLLGRPTFNLGVLQGGSKINIVPDACEAKCDIRTLPGQDVTPVVEKFKSRFPSVEVDLYTTNALQTDPNHPVIAKLTACGGSPTGAPWLCDAAIFAAAGSPAVAVGPGSIQQAHTADEWIAVEDIEKGAEFFRRFLRSLA